MKINKFEIPGLLLLEPKKFGDDRGWFSETWQAQRYIDAGIKEHFVQDNLAFSATKGVLRGLHAQNPHPQGKLVQVIQGSVFDVAVDIREDSPSFGKWQGVELSDQNGIQFYVPPGFLHGYLVLQDNTIFSYKCTDYYHPEDEISVRWDDPQLMIEWPSSAKPQISDKDAAAPFLSEINPKKFSPISP